jgi:hypothetical protein
MREGCMKGYLIALGAFVLLGKKQDLSILDQGAVWVCDCCQLYC